MAFLGAVLIILIAVGAIALVSFNIIRFIRWLIIRLKENRTTLM